MMRGLECLCYLSLTWFFYFLFFKGVETPAFYIYRMIHRGLNDPPHNFPSWAPNDSWEFYLVTEYCISILVKAALDICVSNTCICPGVVVTALE